MTVRPFGHRPTLRSAVLPGCAGGAAGGVGADHRLDLVVAGGRGVVVGLAPDVGVGGVAALRLPVVDEVVRRDRRPVGPDGLGVDLVDHGLWAAARDRSALHELGVQDGLELVVDDEGLGPHHVHDLLQDELRSGRGVDVEPGQVLVERHGGRATRDDDAFVAAPLAVGATAMIDTDSAAAAMAAKADRFKYPLSPIVLPCSSVAPVTADSCAFRDSQCPLSMSEDDRKCNAIATFFCVNSQGNPAETCQARVPIRCAVRRLHTFLRGGRSDASDRT